MQKLKNLRRLEATDERQYLLDTQYEVYEKQGAPLGAVSMHYHSFFEIIYVCEGEYSSMIENQTYHMKKGDFLLIGCNRMHKYHYIENKHDSSRRIILWITGQMLEEISMGKADFTACFTRKENCAYHFPVYYEEMLRGYLCRLAMPEISDVSMKDGKEILDRGYLTLFFVYLNSLCMKKEYLYSAEELVSHPLVEQVSAYIEAHLTETILADDLAAWVHLSKYHFLRRFKELTGVTAHFYINNKRLMKACEELRLGKSISEAYQEAGFHDYSSFLRNFKKNLGVSPGKYKEYLP